MVYFAIRDVYRENTGGPHITWLMRTVASSLLQVCLCDVRRGRNAADRFCTFMLYLSTASAMIDATNSQRCDSGFADEAARIDVLRCGCPVLGAKLRGW
jgi:hypothetical protein